MTRKILLLVFALALWPGKAPAEDVRRTRLDRGDVLLEKHSLPDSDIPEVTVTAVIDSPPERVWPIIDHCGNYMHTMLHIAISKELTRVGPIVRCESTVSLAWPLPDLHAITRAVHTPGPDKWVRAWKMETGDYKVNEGSWTLTVWAPGKTLAEYRMHSEPNVSIPGFVQDIVANSVMPDLMNKLRAETK